MNICVYLTFKCLHSLAPSYLSDMIVKKPSLGLRSELVMPRTHLVTYGDRDLSAAASHIWNSIPVTIRLCGSVTTFKYVSKPTCLI